VDGVAGCARCGEAGTTIVVEFSGVMAYLDLCEGHLADLLAGARPKDVAPSLPHGSPEEAWVGSDPRPAAPGSHTA
jgi:hypothetical protein